MLSKLGRIDRVESGVVRCVFEDGTTLESNAILPVCFGVIDVKKGLDVVLKLTHAGGEFELVMCIVGDTRAIAITVERIENGCEFGEAHIFDVIKAQKAA